MQCPKCDARIVYIPMEAHVAVAHRTPHGKTVGVQQYNA